MVSWEQESEEEVWFLLCSIHTLLLLKDQFLLPTLSTNLSQLTMLALMGKCCYLTTVTTLFQIIGNNAGQYYINTSATAIN